MSDQIYAPEMPAKEKKWHWLFEAALLLRVISGVAEIGFGVFILYADKGILNILSAAIFHISTDAKIFAAIYILAHGVLNIFLSIELHRERLWAYKTSLIVLGLFVIYQVYRINQYHSTTLIVLTVVDALFIALLWHEYKYKLKTML